MLKITRIALPKEQLQKLTAGERSLLFFWGCIAGVMGAFSILIWIAGIAAIGGIVSWGEEANAGAPSRG
jgi:hypothetical protein